MPVIFGVPWVLVSQLFADMVFVGLVSYEINSDFRPRMARPRRRLGGGTAVIWILTTFITFAGGYFFIDVAYGQWLAPYIAPCGGIAGAIHRVARQKPQVSPKIEAAPRKEPAR